MISVVCWLWPAAPRYRSQFNANYVNVFRNMIERHLHIEHEVVCITNMPKGIDPRVRIVPLWDTFAELISPHGGISPACYRRLRAFSPEMKDVIGSRFISFDLDVVIVRDITPIVQRTEDFVMWGSPLRRTPYNGSLWMMTAGARKEVFEQFDPLTSPLKTRNGGFHGSDQAWISYLLGSGEATWTPEKDGVYAFMKMRRAVLPPDARIVFFQGHHDPTSSVVNAMAPWIKEHYW
jgi:hypothetical protein